MCGIFGLIGQHNADEVKAANRTQAHRGPDAEGYWFDLGNEVALCHRRLSILDLSEAGAQPMTSKSGRYVVSYNGELYNFQDLKSQLAQANWRGTSDTEVLLECFDQWGLEKTLEKIEGMYAIALWDKTQKTLTLVRDRLGEKPLYYGLVQGKLIFSSELKPVIALFRSHLTLNPVALEDYFRRSCITGELSVFKEIKKLPAGHFLTLSQAQRRGSLPSPRRYWSLRELSIGTSTLVDLEAIDSLESKLKRAVHQQMISDVPLGAFLSGGIDSSLVVALMQSQSRQKVKTFSIGFENPHYDEAPHAKAVAQHLGTEHEELYVSEKELLEQIPRLGQIYDEPFADSSQIPTILVSQMARKQVTVALSGDGGDELFAGYNRHLFASEKWPQLTRLPVALRALAGQCLTLLPPSAWEQVFRIIASGAAQPHEKVYKLAKVLKSASMSDFYRSVSTHWAEASPMINKDLRRESKNWQVSSVLEMTLADAEWYLPDDVLVKVDRASMSQSLETRAPFLNKSVVEMAFALPMDLKIRDGQSKWILRQILYKHVPKKLIERPKMGFGVPLDSWLRKELKEWAWGLLNPEALAQQNILDAAAILEKWEEHQSGRRNWFTELWDVLMFLSWRQNQRI